MASTAAALSAEELLNWCARTAEIWRKLASEHPALLDVPCDIYKARTVGELLQHIVATELRYAERLGDEPVTDYAQIPFATSDELFATHDRAVLIFKRLLGDAHYDWGERIEFTTLTAGRRSALRSAVLHHALLHAIRHYAQLATLARQHCFRLGPADFLITNSIIVE